MRDRSCPCSPGYRQDPTEELRLLIAPRDEETAPGEALSYGRRYALAILAVLDLMGDDA
ncbi:hypothetical protein ACVV2G_08270 [Streptomyces ziwulingensis]